MYRLHLKRNLSTLALLLAIAAVLGGIGMLWWATRTGMRRVNVWAVLNVEKGGRDFLAHRGHQVAVALR